MKITVHFKPNTAADYGVRLVVNIPFIRLWPKSASICITYSGDNKQSVEKVEIFIPERLMAEVPKFFTGELKMLSSQISSVSRA